MEKQFETIIERIASKLEQLGYYHADALVLSALLISSDDMTSHEIERRTWLRQPQVSISLSHLIDQKMVIQSATKPLTVGRPLKLYRVNRPSVVLNNIKNKIMDEATEKMRTIEKIEMILNGNEKIPGDISDNPS
jgi:predicted transcriptional regulator